MNAEACVAGREFHDEWIEELSALIPEDDTLHYSNPEGAIEAIILDCFRVYKAERDAARAEVARLRAAVEEALASGDGKFVILGCLRRALAATEDQP